MTENSVMQFKNGLAFGVYFYFIPSTVRGYEHQKAGTAESVIALVLLIGLILTLIRPQSTRGIGLAVQGFALLGTLVGIFTIVFGIGPRTIPDIAYHCVIVAVLVWGLVKTSRT